VQPVGVSCSVYFDKQDCTACELWSFARASSNHVVGCCMRRCVARCVWCEAVIYFINHAPAEVLSCVFT
jgi:hypothetical protein